MKDKMDKWAEKARTAIKWVAVDERGLVCAYVDEPKKVNTCIGGAWAATRGGGVAILGQTDNEELRKNWHETLTEVKYEQ